jgi:hypothetical protein
VRRWNVRALALSVALAVSACDGGAPDTGWHQESGYRWRELDVASRGASGFRKLSSASTGITHRNDVADEHAIYNRNLLIGSGVAAGDVDGDGLPDLFVASVEHPSVLYRNAGDFRFVDITATAGLNTQGLAATAAAFADVNGDANLDLIVGTLGGPLKLWLGDGKAKFTDASSGSGLAEGFAATTMTLADVDGDDDLDLYVGTYKKLNALDAYTPQQRAFDQTVKKIGAEYRVLDEWKAVYRIEDHPELGGIIRSQRAEPDLFYLNDGAGKFTRIAQAGARFAGEDGKPLAADPDYFTLASRFYDVNDDGAPDLYVCNDFEDPDQFWINDGKGNFRLLPGLSLRETSNTCMSVDFGDINRDGHVDFFTADMMSPTLEQRQRQFPTHTPTPKPAGLPGDRHQWMRNMLQLSRGDGTWASIGDFAGVSGTDWTWGSAFLDVDLDGFEDLIALNGHRWDVRDADTFDRIRNSFPRVAWNREQGEFPASNSRSVVFRNNRDLTFRDMSREWGIGSDAAISQGLALADFDGDGDQDLVASRLNAAPAVYRNNSSAPRIAIRLVGAGANRQGIGAKVTVRSASIPAQTREMTAGGYYLSGSDALLTFAAPDSVAAVEVRWRNGRASTLGSLRRNRVYEIHESSAAEYVATQASARPRPLFESATSLLGGHIHVDSSYDDYVRQPLLPTKLSQLGPGVTWTDVNTDGRPDLVIGSGRGGRLSVLRNDGSRFTRSEVGGTAAGDLTTALPIPNGRGGTSLIVGQSNYEATSISAALAIPRVLSIGQSPIAGGDTGSVGPMALGDVNGDGRLDLFVGARAVPGLWPLPAPSRLYLRSSSGAWTLDSANARTLASIGLVSAALFTDLDGDGRSELVTTSEWGPVRVFRSGQGRLTDVTSAWGLSGRTSRWNGLSAGDFNGDGRMDLVVTSWGRNMPWGASIQRPLVLIAGNFGGQGLGLVFARADSTTRKEMPLETFARVELAVPSVKTRFRSFTEYSKASVGELLGDQSPAGVRVGATTFDHLVLLNTGGRFDARVLPPEAQLAPAFAPVVADFDGDGREDLFLAQNFSPTEIETPRLNAGTGLVLMGDGQGSFRPATIAESGIRVLGDQRGAAVADYDRDARIDLAVSQNGAATTLWHNVGATPGIRVQMLGSADNPQLIGAQVRVVNGDEMGPVREVRAGGAYWSVDEPLVVLGAPKGATRLWVRVPGGRTAFVPVAAGQHEVRIRASDLPQ